MRTSNTSSNKYYIVICCICYVTHPLTRNWLLRRLLAALYFLLEIQNPISTTKSPLRNARRGASVPLRGGSKWAGLMRRVLAGRGGDEGWLAHAAGRCGGLHVLFFRRGFSPMRLMFLDSPRISSMLLDFYALSQCFLLFVGKVHDEEINQWGVGKDVERTSRR